MKAIHLLTWLMIILLAWRYLHIFYAIDEIIPLLFSNQKADDVIKPERVVLNRKVFGKHVRLTLRLLLLLITAVGLAVPLIMGGLYLLKLNQN